MHISAKAASTALVIGLFLAAANPGREAQAEESPRGRIHRSLPEPLTSFGAAVLGEHLYVFSGHSGAAHGFGKDMLVDAFRRIEFDEPSAEWETLAMHAPAQSVALVTDGEFLYRVGGLSFLNKSGEETNFNSTTHFARYDKSKNEWEDLAPLPEARSSLDAAVLGRSVYVAGGWNLQGKSSRDVPWHDTILRFNLDDPDSGWKELDGPGYNTRAVSLAAFEGKLYLFGGIQSRGITKKVSVYDPKANQWSDGPEICADHSAAGFATSSFATGGHLYYSGSSGIVYRLNPSADGWDVVDRLFFPRMFHRLLPLDQDRLIALGGTGRGTGRLASVESLNVSRAMNEFKQTQWSLPFPGQAKHNQVCILDGSELYVFGGNSSLKPKDFGTSVIHDECFAFNIVDQSIEELPPLPAAMQSGAGIAFRQTSEHKVLMVAGGLSPGETLPNGLPRPRSSIYQFDPESKSWTTMPQTLPEPRAFFFAGAHDSAIWMFGGIHDGVGDLPTSVLHWWGDESDIAPLRDVELPEQRRSFGAARIDDDLYLVGGIDGDGKIVNSVDVFNFEKREWRTTDLPITNRVFPRLVASQGKLFLFGGFRQKSPGDYEAVESLEEFDPKTGTWTLVRENIPNTHSFMSMFDFNERLLFFGISGDSEKSANFVMFDPAPTREPQLVKAGMFGRRRNSDQAATNAKMLMRRDADKDNRLAKHELGKRMAGFFKQADSDQDGFLTLAEVKLAYQSNESESKDTKTNSSSPAKTDTQPKTKSEAARLLADEADRNAK
ncbi:MAG: kelch repeat-containing protein, partial [Planctomycetota bacterium]